MITFKLSKKSEEEAQRHRDEYIDDQLKEVGDCFKLISSPHVGNWIKKDVHKVRSLLMDIYKTGSLSKS